MFKPMYKLCREDYPYQADASEVFAAVADEPYAAFLDSGRSANEGASDGFLGRYDILVYQPDTIITTIGEFTVVHSAEGSIESTDDPFAVIQQVLVDSQRISNIKTDSPFIGGALGYFSYDLARQVEHLPEIAEKTSAFPDMQFGIYDSALIFDHQRETAVLVGYGDADVLRKRFDQWRSRLKNGRSTGLKPLKVLEELSSNMDFELYQQKFKRVKDYIRDGDVYQINLAQRWSAKAEGNAWEAYRLMRESSPAPFGAYLNSEFGEVLSNSPERFVQVLNGLVTAAPIKGTQPRVVEDEQTDRSNAEALVNSSKDQAENLMIVDLLRNDLGRVCKTGTVEVKKLFELQSFANVHHLVSTITGQLAEGKHALDLMRACFPGGSITGAPKVRAMEVIEELESDRRGIYCGSIAYISFNGNMDSNIAIRTLVHEGGELHFSAGGGLVSDSDVEAEFQESLLKAGVMRRVVTI
jgi:para-aminobenzoate synthetase component I